MSWALAVAVACVICAGLGAAENDPNAEAAPREHRTDLYGDPLPDGALARLGTIRWRHASPVSFVAFTPNGKAVVTACQDDVIRLWDLETGKQIRRFERQQADKSAPGRYALEAELLARQQRLMLPGNGVGGPMVALAPDGKTLAASTPYGTIQLWDVATGKATRQIKGPPTGVGMPTFSPDSKTIIARGGDQTIYFWNAASGEELHQIQARKQKQPLAGAIRLRGNINNTPVFSPDGTMLAAAEFAVNNRKPNLIKIWDAETGKEFDQIEVKEPNGIFAVAFSPDGKTLAYTGRTTIHLLDTATGVQIRQFQGQQPGLLANLVFSPDSKTLAVKGLVGSVVTLYQVATGQELRKLYQSPQGPAQPGLAGRYAAASREVAFSPDGKVVAVGGGNTVRLWDAATGREIGKEGGHQSTITALALSPDGKVAVSRGQNNTFRVWETTTGKQRGEFHGLPGTGAVALSPDRTIVALAGGDNIIRVLEVATGKNLHQLSSGQNGIAALTFSPSGKTLASRGTRDNSIRLFDAASGRELRLIALPAPTAGAAGPGVVFISVGGISGSSSSLVFSPDGRIIAAVGTNPTNNPYIAAGGSVGTPLFLMDVATGKEVRRLELPLQPGVAGFAFAPDGRTLATENLDRTVSIWEIASGKVRLQFGKGAQGWAQTVSTGGVAGARRVIALPQDNSRTLVFGPDGRTLIVKRQGGAVLIRDALTGKSLGGLAGHDGAVTALALASDGKTLVTGSSDTTMLVWDLTRFRSEKQQQGELKAGEIAGLWDVLGGLDANLAFGAVGRLSTNSPGQVVTFLGGQLKPTEHVAAGKIDGLIRDLESTKFRVRQQAWEELEKLGELAEPALHKALAAQPSLEALRRIQRLLEKLAGAAPLSPDRVRLVRAIEVLEQIGSPQAQEVLRSLAGGAPGALPTREAQAALDRLARQVAAQP
jgi:WD40 repeat protein